MKSALKMVNPDADAVTNKGQALAINSAAAQGLASVMRSNIGPTGTMKMLVDGAGEITLTKDGSHLLGSMQIQHPTAQLISRAAVAQDDVVGDGTSSCVVFIGELLKQAERYLSEGVHPRLIADGFDVAKTLALEYLETLKITKDATDREVLTSIARSTLQTKASDEMCVHLTDIVVDAILTIQQEGVPIDTHMVEMQALKHRLGVDTQLIRGLVLDHGPRHPDMPTRVENAYIFACSLEMEYEKTEVNSAWYYNTAEQRESQITAERAVVNRVVESVIALKKQVCDGTDKKFVVINLLGIDPLSLDMFAREGIMALRRAKRRNMERLNLVCGSECVNSHRELDPKCLGEAGLVYETTLGDDKFTFVEEVKNPHSCAILVRGPNNYTISMVNSAIKDGLRSVKNTIECGTVVPGAGAFEVGCAKYLLDNLDKAEGRSKLGVQSFAEALLIIPKSIAENSGYDVQDSIIKLQEQVRNHPDVPVGFDINSGEVLNPAEAGILDTYLSKRHMIVSAPVIANQLLLVDEILKAGGKKRGEDPMKG
jgi:T-complex protein 1 subunit zeta